MYTITNKYISDNITFTADDIKAAYRQHHIELKRMYGLENLCIYYNRHNYIHCKYIADPEDFNYENVVPNDALMFWLTSLTMQQGYIYFDDIGRFCVGLDDLKGHYLPMKLAGIT